MTGCTDQPQPKPQIKQVSGGRERGRVAANARIVCSLELRVRLSRRVLDMKARINKLVFFHYRPVIQLTLLIQGNTP